MTEYKYWKSFRSDDLVDEEIYDLPTLLYKRIRMSLQYNLRLYVIH